ncbi:MAG: hypothetical protein HYY17_02945, partial [Planctomycetes bacterium]|nr:hypothetical protein [Planctomycetota bacterium]
MRDMKLRQAAGSAVLSLLALLGCATPPRAPERRTAAAESPVRVLALRAAPGDDLFAGPNGLLLHPATFEPITKLRVTATEAVHGRLVPLLFQT